MFSSMSENVQTAMFEILKAIQAELSDHRKLFRGIDERLERIEALHRKDRRNSAAMLVMMRATAGDFEERVTEVEQRMESLERRFPSL